MALRSTRRVAALLLAVVAPSTLLGCAPAVLRLGTAPELRPAIATVERTGTHAQAVALELTTPGYVTLLEVLSTRRVTLLRTTGDGADTLLTGGRHRLALARGTSAVAPRLRFDMQPQPGPGAQPRGDFEDLGRARTEPCPDAPPSASNEVPRCLARPWAGATPVAPRYFLVVIVTAQPVDDRALEAALEQLSVSHRADDLVEAAVRLVADAAETAAYSAEAREFKVSAP